jgi:hypothetical protein
MLAFDRPSDSSPLLVAQALGRGQQLVNMPVFALIVCGFSIAAFAALFSLTLAILPAVAGFVLGWLWWSYPIPQWRSWAHQRGVDPEELQRRAIAAGLVWPKGSIFGRTEFGSHKR